MKHRIITTIVALTVVISVDYIQAQYPVYTDQSGNQLKASFGTLQGHPRLMLTADELPFIRERVQHPDFAEVAAAFALQKNYPTDGKVQSDKPDERIRQKMEALAFDFLLDPSGNKASGLEAVKIAINYLSSYTELRKEVQKGYSDNLRTYEAVIGASLVYDWCYDLLTDSDKSLLIELMKSTCQLAEYGFPPGRVKQYLSGHYGEYGPTAYLAMGIAIYDEEPELFQFAYSEQVYGFAPSRNPLFESMTHHQGAQYIHVRASHEMLQHFILDKLGLSPYDKSLGYMTYRPIYGTIPQKTDMDGMEEGDCHNHLEMGNSQLYYLGATITGDPWLQAMARRQLPATLHQSTRLFLMYDPTIESAELNDLCLTKYFPSPSGIMIARTGWDLDRDDYDSDVMVVLMNMKEYNTQNHTHMDQGHFSIYYKGHLALDSGIYQGKDEDNGWGKTNHINYYTRTIAHNCLLVLDPNEPIPYAGWRKEAAARDGGQFFKSPRAWETAEEMFREGKQANVLAAEISEGSRPDYSYLKGDMTESYKVPDYIASDYPSKIDTVRRSFVFLNHRDPVCPGTLIVLDKVVSTNPAFKKTWLLHTQNEPSVEGDLLVAINENNGRQGKLVTKMIYPQADNRHVELVGGPGKEYWADGHNWGTVTQEDAGRWRVEVSPLKECRADIFLNVIQAMRSDAAHITANISTVKSECGKYVALEVEDRIILHNLDLETYNATIRVNAGSPDKTYRILVTELESGDWRIKNGAGSSIFTASDNNTIYFESQGGIIELVKI